MLYVTRVVMVDGSDMTLKLNPSELRQLQHAFGVHHKDGGVVTLDLNGGAKTFTVPARRIVMIEATRQ